MSTDKKSVVWPSSEEKLESLSSAELAELYITTTDGMKDRLVIFPSDEKLKSLSLLGLAEFYVLVEKRLWYRTPELESEKLWAGEYCGNCKDKSRPYETGTCSCLSRIRDAIISRVINDLKEKNKYL